MSKQHSAFACFGVEAGMSPALKVIPTMIGNHRQSSARDRSSEHLSCSLFKTLHLCFLPIYVRQTEMAKSQFVFERQSATVNPDDTAGHGDFRKVNDVTHSVIRRLAHKQLPIEDAIPDPIEQNALRS